jgi:hypothetical protein
MTPDTGLSDLQARRAIRPTRSWSGYGAWCWSASRAPALVFTVIYSITCLVGATLYLIKASLFVQLTEYFTGSKPPVLSASQEAIDLLLLIAVPAFLWFGYELALMVPRHRLPGAGYVTRGLSSLQLREPVWLPTAAFLCSALLALGAIIGSGTEGHLSSWLDYSAGIKAREKLTHNVSFFGFVDIYTIVPLTAAWVIITVPVNGLRGVLLRSWPVLVTVAVDLLLFQKRSAIASLLIIFFAWLAAGELRFSRRRVQLAVVCLCAVAIVYFTGVVAPVKAHDRLCGIPHISCDVITRDVPPVVLYAAMAPFTRASVPALYYPVIFPAHHSFYGPDFGQDIVGIGHYPDDNVVVWHYINGPTAGTTAVPFQFTLYSEDGIVGALLIGPLIGAVLALGWRLRRGLPRAWSGLLGAMVLTFAAFLAEDSLRNSVLVSYGVLYGLIFLAVMALAVHVLNVGIRSTRFRSRIQRRNLFGIGQRGGPQ